jgi:hypothetical protein
VIELDTCEIRIFKHACQVGRCKDAPVAAVPKELRQPAFDQTHPRKSTCDHETEIRSADRADMHPALGALPELLYGRPQPWVHGSRLRLDFTGVSLHAVDLPGEAPTGPALPEPLPS